MRYDVIVIGAGVAGLACTSVLTRAGAKVLCLEASGRIGGRIRTVHHPDCPLPFELGAEFVHGVPTETWDLAKQANLLLFERSTKAVHLKDGRVVGKEEAGEKGDEFLKRKRVSRKDRPVAEGPARTKGEEWAITHLEGFNAIHRERASLAALKRDSDAAEAIEGDRLFQIAAGYDAIPAALRQSIPAAHHTIVLNHQVDRIVWRRNQARLFATQVLREGFATFEAKRVVIAVPLGVLQAGSIVFDPVPQRNLEAASRLEFGHVFRVSMQFADAFWEERKDLEDASFFLSQEKVFPVWWTSKPAVAPVLTGWAAGPAADPLLALDNKAIFRQALDSLSQILGGKVPQPQRVHFHDWSKDPLFRGAYSSVPVNASRARAALASPVEDTLYFAGEATELTGRSATVHGALASGRRVAERILKSG